jgi:hypothetical protein
MSPAIPNPRRRLRLLLVLVLLSLALPLAGSFLLNRYLRGEKFLALANYGASVALNMDGRFQPLHWSQSDVYSDGFLARGRPGHPFREVRLDGVRAELSKQGLWHRTWVVDGVTVRRLQLAIGQDGDPAGPEAFPVLPDSVPGLGPIALLLPRDVEVRRVSIREADVAWPMAPGEEGTLKGAMLDATPRDGGWHIEGRGGHLTLPGRPALNLKHYEADYRQDTVYLTRAELHPVGRGRITVTGSIDPAANVVPDLALVLKSLPVEPWLPRDWRARLSGDLSGDVRVEGAGLSGTLSLDRGILTAVPVLDEIAAFTKTERFRRLVLHRMRCDFTSGGGRLEVSNFKAESEGLLRVEGGCTVIGESLDARLQVGVDPDTLRWIPGGGAKVFTEKRDGYAWAPMRITGTMDEPVEDLSPRLIRAAGEAIVESVAENFEDISSQVRDAAENALERILSP